MNSTKRYRVGEEVQVRWGAASSQWFYAVVIDASEQSSKSRLYVEYESGTCAWVLLHNVREFEV